MSEITAITPQVKDKTRCNIYVDGRFYCGLSLETTMKNRLKVGQTIDPERLSQIQLESEKAKALDKALNFISAAQKTEKQVREYLASKGYLAAVVDYAIEKMREYSFLDDQGYAEHYANFAIKRKGARLIRMELRQKGLSDEAVENALDGLEGEEETAKKLLEKYMRGKSVDRETLYKAFRYLIGKGFDYEIAKNALQIYGEEEL